MAQVSSPHTARWGIIGVGVAGQARARAIRDDPRAVCVGGFRGDPAAVDIPAFDSLDVLLDACDAVAVCSPDIHHKDHVLAALKAGKHVVCEFPLAGNAADAAALFHVARRAKLVLHVEHIELLTPAARWIRGRCVMRQLQSGTVRFTSGVRQGVASLAHANMARLHRLVDAVGMPHGVRVVQRGQGLLRAHLDYPGEGVELELRQEPDAKRKFELSLHLNDGWILQVQRRVLEGGQAVELPDSPGLFLADQLVATATILDGVPGYLSPEQVVDRLSLADQLASLAPLLPADEDIPRRKKWAGPEQ